MIFLYICRMETTLLLHFPIKSVGAYPLIGDVMRRWSSLGY